MVEELRYEEDVSKFMAEARVAMQQEQNKLQGDRILEIKNLMS